MGLGAILGAMAGGAGDILNSALGIGGTMLGNEQQHNYNEQNMRRQHRYNLEYMNLAHTQAKEKMQSAWQWEINDMKKAGINPVAVMGGQASGPSMAGGSGSGGNVSPGAETAGNLGANITAAMDLMRMKSEINKTNAETNLINEQSGKTRQETLATMQNIKESQARTLNIIEDSNLKEAQKAKIRTEIQGLYLEFDKVAEEIKIAQKKNDILAVQKAFAKADAIQRQITGYVDSATGLIGAIKGTSALPINTNSHSNNVNWMQM